MMVGSISLQVFENHIWRSAIWLDIYRVFVFNIVYEGHKEMVLLRVVLVIMSTLEQLHQRFVVALNCMESSIPTRQDVIHQLLNLIPVHALQHVISGIDPIYHLPVQIGKARVDSNLLRCALDVVVNCTYLREELGC